MPISRFMAVITIDNLKLFLNKSIFFNDTQLSFLLKTVLANKNNKEKLDLFLHYYQISDTLYQEYLKM
jgi:hypothetical protein